MRLREGLMIRTCLDRSRRSARPQHVDAELVGEPDLLVLRLIVAHALPAVSGRHHLDAYVHNSLPAGALEIS
jgi:hypothetical protein